jgi:hypothetical protein
MEKSDIFIIGGTFMYIMVEFVDCENVNGETREAFEAFFNTIEGYFGDWRDESTELELSRTRFESNYKNHDNYDVALFFKATNGTRLEDDVFEYYSKILGCKNGFYIEIRETPFDES